MIQSAADVWIHTEALSKTYGDFTALRDLSLQIRRGEVFGFLGPNGAGKTTTIKILMGILVPSSGRAQICGLDCQHQRVETKRLVGYLPDDPIFYDYLRGRELLRFVGEMHGLQPEVLEARQAALLARMQLVEAAEEFAVNYSKGMKKKLALCMALMHEPSVLILDEPTTGLDPSSARHIRELVRATAQEGKTVFLSTHLLDMAERLCDRVAIIHQGQLVAVGTPAELRADLSAEASLEEVFLAVTEGGDEAQTDAAAAEAHQSRTDSDGQR